MVLRQLKKTTPDERSALYDRTVRLELIGVALLIIFIILWVVFVISKGAIAMNVTTAPLLNV